MGRGLRAIGSALAQIYSHFGTMLVSNILAFVLSLPVILLVGLLSYLLRSFSLIPLGVAVLVGVLPCPTTAGLQYVASELAGGEITVLQDNWTGLRHYWSLSIRAWLVGVGGTILILGNLAFYVHLLGNPHSAGAYIGAPLAVLWFALLVIWLGLHIYVFPLLIVQEVKSVRLAYRNAFVMQRERKLFTFTILPIWLLFLLFTSATGLATVIGLAIGASIQQNALVRILPSFPSETAAQASADL